MTSRVLHGNALNLPLADNTVDLVVTSPPYFGLRSYQDAGEHYTGQLGSEATPAEFVDALLAATREMVRVTKPCGSIWVNLGDKYAGGGMGPQGTTGSLMTDRSYGDRSRKPTQQERREAMGTTRAKSLIGIPWRYALRCIDDLGLILRAEIIWAKPNGLPESVTDRVRRSHEQWFHFTLNPRYYSAVDEIREAHGTAGRVSGKGSGQALGTGVQKAHTLDPDQQYNALGKLPGSVWTIPTQPLTVPAHVGVDHFAAFPMEWPRRIIRGWSPPDGTILDPFGGTGTTALVASALGRHGISVDMSADYCRLATWRTNDPAQRASALQVDKPPVEIVGQADLFEKAMP